MADLLWVSLFLENCYSTLYCREIETTVKKKFGKTAYKLPKGVLISDPSEASRVVCGVEGKTLEVPKGSFALSIG
jgi:hypothetical protein